MSSDHENGRIPERIRTWPDAVRGEHPEANLVAIGPRAAWLVSPHPYDEAYGTGTPLERLVEADGQVLMLGAPLGTLTVLHHAEALADVPSKAGSRMPLMQDGSRVWREFHDIDTSSYRAFAYERVVSTRRFARCYCCPGTGGRVRKERKRWDVDESSVRRATTRGLRRSLAGAAFRR